MADPIEAWEPPEYEVSLEAARADDNDSTYSDKPSLTESITSSIYNYNSEYGRTYHTFQANKYLMPNDEPEKDRMDIHYHAMRILFNDRPFFAPVGPRPQSIIDQGTGTGIWVMDVADMYPSAHVIGTDLSPIQPSWVPPNVEFIVDDLEKPWIFADNTFDLVHDRLCGGLAIKNWSAYLAEAFRTTKPGGWVEAQEFNMIAGCDDGTVHPGSAIAQWHDLYAEGALKAGFDMRVSAERLAGYFGAAGLINVQKLELKVPIGPWPKDPTLKEVGLFTLSGNLEGISGLSLQVFTKGLGWSLEELEVLLAKVRSEWRKRSVHQYWPVVIVYGQKPGAEKHKMDYAVE